MGFSLKGAISGAISGFTSTGNPWGAVAGAGLGGFLGEDDDSMSALDAYRMQRADALSDWNRQNAYNNPKAQMQRLEEAGLNPYLVYSSGNAVGNSSSNIDNVQYSSNGVRSAQPQSYALTKALQSLNLRSMQADTKGKEVDTEMRELDLQLKKARIARLLTGSAPKDKPVDLEKEQYDDIMRGNRVENSIRGTYQNGFLGRLPFPFVGNYLADVAYRNDLKVRQGLAKKQGIKPWQSDYRSIFSSDY